MYLCNSIHYVFLYYVLWNPCYGRGRINGLSFLHSFIPSFLIFLFFSFYSFMFSSLFFFFCLYLYLLFALFFFSLYLYLLFAFFFWFFIYSYFLYFFFLWSFLFLCFSFLSFVFLYFLFLSQSLSRSFFCSIIFFLTMLNPSAPKRPIHEANIPSIHEVMVKP